MHDDPLAALWPLHVPMPDSWWPPAAGWWFLAMVVVLLGIMVYRHWQRMAPRRAALYELKILEQQQHQNQLTAALLNGLLKRYALVCWPGTRVAALTGEQWLMFLDAHGGDGQFLRGDGRCLETLPYRDEPLQLDKLVLLVRRWIKKNKPGEHR